jgi:hypothetical protein
VSALQAKLAAIRAQLEASRVRSERATKGWASDVARAREARDVAERMRREAEAADAAAKAKAAAEEQRLLARRSRAAEERRALLRGAQDAVNREVAARDAARRTLANVTQEADARVRQSTAAAATAARSAAQLQSTLQEHARVLAGLTQTLAGLRARNSQTQLRTAADRGMRSAQLAARRQSVLAPLQERIQLTQAQEQAARGQRAAVLAAAETELQYSVTALGRKRNETEEELTNNVNERRVLRAALLSARSALFDWRRDAAALTDRQDNETSRRQGSIRALKQSAAGAADRQATAAALHTQAQLDAKAAIDAVASRRESLQRAWQAEKVDTARQLQLQAASNEEARVARERVRRDAERAAIEQTAALKSQAQVLSGEVDSLLSRREGLQAELALVQVRRPGGRLEEV